MYKKFIISGLMVTVVTLWMSASVKASNAYLQKAELHDFLSGGELPGGGLLTRDLQTAHVVLAASGLDQNAAYSVWWVIFNNPEACANGIGSCGAKT